jgi:hypothetical protein
VTGSPEVLVFAGLQQ